MRLPLAARPARAGSYSTLPRTQPTNRGTALLHLPLLPFFPALALALALLALASLQPAQALALAGAPSHHAHAQRPLLAQHRHRALLARAPHLHPQDLQQPQKQQQEQQHDTPPLLRRRAALAGPDQAEVAVKAQAQALPQQNKQHKQRPFGTASAVIVASAGATGSTRPSMAPAGSYESKNGTTGTGSGAHATTTSGTRTGAGSARPAAATAASSGSNGTFWVGNIDHNGLAAFDPAPTDYAVYRNVRTFGAVGDGLADDTAAINAAIASAPAGQARCGGGSCDSSTTSPALVYFPPGTYRVTSPIVSYYYTQLVGDANDRPTLKADAGFQGIAVIDEDPYLPGGANWYTNQNNFFREVRNFIIDLTAQPASTGTGIHHQVSQATGLYNVKFVMRTDSDTAQQGIFMENGSGGLLRDCEFQGGKLGAYLGNQQFTVRNLTFSGCQVAIQAAWAWGWSYAGVRVENCGTGMQILTGTSPTAQAAASELLVDWQLTNVPVAFDLIGPANNGTLILENIATDNVPVIVRDAGQVLVQGSSGSTHVASFVQGDVARGAASQGRLRGALPWTTQRSAALTDDAGRWVMRPRPQYENQPLSAFVNVKDHGAMGDGSTDDTKALQAVLNQYGASNIIFVPHGTYMVSSTLKIPIGTRMVGEVWSVLMGTGSAFSDASNPTPVFQVGAPGDAGVLEITDIIFTIRGPAPGAIVLEWNVRDSPGQQATVGMWDTHVRIGGFAGSNLQGGTCPKGTTTVNDECRAAFLAMHVTSQASGFFDNVWVWIADHDLDYPGRPQLNIYNGRGILIEASEGPVWMYGTASEHSQLYQYNIVNAKNVLVMLGQTETPYMQGTGFPTATTVEPPSSAYHDPSFNCADQSDPMCNKAWGTVVTSSSNVYLYGLGQYSFFNNYQQDCLSAAGGCQQNIVAFNSVGDDVYLHNLNTVGTEVMIVQDGQAQVEASAHVNGFTSTLAAWIPQ